MTRNSPNMRTSRKRERPPQGRPPRTYPASRLELRGDRVERGRQVGAECRRSSDDHNGDESGNQTILNGRRAGLVTNETRKEIHESLHLICSTLGTVRPGT